MCSSRRLATPLRVQHRQEFARRRRRRGIPEPDDGDRPPNIPAPKPNEREGAGAQLTFDRESAAPGHAITTGHGQLHRLPGWELETSARGDAGIGPGCLDRRSRGRSLLSRDPRHRFRMLPRQRPASELRGPHDDDLVLHERLRFDLGAAAKPPTCPSPKPRPADPRLIFPHGDGGRQDDLASTVRVLSVNACQQPQPGPTGRATTSNFLCGQLGGFGARRTRHCPHNPKVAGSNPAPATNRKPRKKRLRGFVFLTPIHRDPGLCSICAWSHGRTASTTGWSGITVGSAGSVET